MQAYQENYSFKIGKIIGHCLGIFLFSAVIFLIIGKFKINLNLYTKIVLILGLTYLFLLCIKRYNLWS